MPGGDAGHDQEALGVIRTREQERFPVWDQYHGVTRDRMGLDQVGQQDPGGVVVVAPG